MRHGAEVPGLADVLGSVHEEMLNNGVQHHDVVLGQVVLALLLVTLQAGAVVLGEVGHDFRRSLLDQVAQTVHLIDALLAVQGRAHAGNGEEKDDLEHVGGEVSDESQSDTEESCLKPPLYTYVHNTISYQKVTV